VSITAARAGIGLLALSGWIVAPAQEAPAELAPVEVRATRTPLALADVPGAITVIDGDDLRQGRMPSSLAEALIGVPGLFIQNADNFSQDARIALRGFGAQAAFGIRGVAILVDGVPQTLPDGQAQVDSIDLAEVERIEILRGPASALYGNAAGGVILITTRPVGERASASVRQDIGEFGRLDSHAAFSAPVGPVGLRFSAGRFELDGFRDHSRVEQYRASLKLDWRPGANTRVDATAGYFEAPEEQDPGGVTAELARQTPRAARDANVRFDAGETLEQWRFSAGVRHRLGGDPNHRLRLTGFAFLRDFANKLPFSGGGQVAFDRRFTGLDAQHEIQRDVFGLDLRLTSGVDLRRQRDERERFNNLDGVRGAQVLDQREMVDAIGIYTQAGIALAPNWRLTAGVRFDEVRLDVDDRLLADGDDSGRRNWRETSPAIGIAWRPRDDLNLFASFGSAFQTPTTTELANPEDPAAGGGFNRGLGPETARTLELGLRWRAAGRGHLEASVFRTRVDDAILSIEVPEVSGSGRDFFANVGRSTRRGIELDAGLRLSSRLELEAGYTGSDFKFDRFETADGDFSGNRLPGVPKHRYHARLNYRDPSDRHARLEVFRVGKFFADNANTATNDARTQVRFSAGQDWRLRDWTVRLTAGVHNLLDQRYNDNVRINAFGGRYFEPAPDRHWFASLGLRWR